VGARSEDLWLAVLPPSPSLEEFCKNASALPEHWSWWLVATSPPQGCRSLKCSALLSAALTDWNCMAGALLPGRGAMAWILQGPLQQDGVLPDALRRSLTVLGSPSRLRRCLWRWAWLSPWRCGPSRAPCAFWQACAAQSVAV